MGFFASQSQRTSLSPYHFSSSSSLSFSSSSPMPRNHRFSFFLFLFLNSSVFFFIPCFSVNDQGQALLSWKSQLNISGDALSSWNAAESNPCKWVGIRCNARGQVSEIQLQVTDFQGPLPATNLLQLKSLTSLRLTSVNLTGFIPKELGDLPELEVLDLADNSLSGEIPVEIFKLKKLKTLSLNTNNLEGAIPSELGNLTNLVELTLFDNKLAGEIPKSIGELKNLQTFRAGGNKNLRGELPWEIGNCESLVTLGLAETSLSGKLPASIGNLKHVQTIALYTSLFSGPIPDEIGNCTELQNLYLYQNSISRSIPTTLGGLKNLQSLLLWQNNLVGKIPVELGNCPDLFLIDLSENLLTGNIPRSFGNLPNLQELQLSVNQLSGTIPEELANCTKLTHLEIDNNRISGEIPQLKLTSLTMFFAWSNQLTGKIPESLSQCEELQAIDLSYNALSGSIPNGIFDLRNLTKLLLLSNSLSGSVPPEIGNCTSLYRLRLNGNRLAGNIPSEIGNLKNLNFIDISENRLAGNIPPAISGCESLEFLDLHSNGLTGSLPGTLPKSLQFIDFSDNSLTGSLPSGIGSLTELTKLNLAKNRLSGSIPREISSCRSLQLLNLGDNGFTGDIPDELGRIPSLAISLNLSCNSFSGVIPSRFSSLVNLGTLDVSHNKLAGNLNALADLQNLVSLNISFNEFSGELPNTLFFRKLPLSVLESNRGLFISTRPDTEIQTRRHRSAVKLAMSILVAASVVLVLMAVYTLVKAQRVAGKQNEELDTWEVTLYQKLDFSIDDIVKNLTSANVIGTGSSGVVYRVTIPSGETLAVKKMWSKEETGAFNSEINTLGLIRHRNIIRLLGWCSNKNLKLLFYDYLPNGSLSSLLHGAGKGRGGADWEARYDVVLGVAHALAYLHHDCLPPILHGDVKAMNVLLGSRFEPFLADFGLAKTVSCEENNDVDSSKSSNRPPLAGSYGYMAPEHASMQRITEKSDVYSFGVVLLEVLTGKHPLDPDLPGGAHLVQWVRDHLAKKKAPGEILDPRLRGRADPIMHEMLQTLAVAFLCVSNKAADRPMMKDIVAMLKEIRQLDVGRSDNDMLKGGKCEKWQPQPLPPEKFVTPRGSSNCSFAFSDESV